MPHRAFKAVLIEDHELKLQHEGCSCTQRPEGAVGYSEASDGAARLWRVTDEDPETSALLSAAVNPSYAEIQQARTHVLETLYQDQDRAIDISKLRDSFCTSLGVAAPQQSAHVPMTSEDERLSARESSIVKWHRYRFAIDTAASDLVSEGTIAEFAGISGRIPYVRGGLSTSAPVAGLTVVSQGKFGLAPRFERRSPDEIQLSSEALFLADLTDLLGERGCECIREALKAFRAQLYLASVNLLGAACEAAWYKAGETLADSGNDIADALSRQQTSRVVARTINVLTTKKNEHQVIELATFEQHIRALRNYGIHPRNEHEPVMATAFTEAGTWCLLSGAHRHLANLGSQLTAAVARSTSAAN